MAKIYSCKSILRAIPFVIIGFCLLWTIYANYYEKTFDSLSSNIFSSTAQRFKIDSSKSDEFLLNELDDDSILFCDLNETSNLKGVYAGKNANFSIPLMEGVFFSQLDFSENKPVAVVGKQVAKNLEERDSHLYLKIAGEEYEVIGIMGVPSVSSAVDYMILTTMDRAKNIFGNDRNLTYTLDGPERSQRSTLMHLENAGITYDTLALKTVNLDKLYSTDYSSNTVYVSFLIIIIPIFILFVFLEIYMKRNEIQVYLVNGATTLQIVVILLKKHMLANYVGLAIGMGIAFGVLSSTLSVVYSFIPLICAVLISFIIIVASIFFSSLILQKQEFTSHSKKQFSAISKCLFALVLVATSFTLIFANIALISYQSQRSTHNTFSDQVNKLYYTITMGLPGDEFDAATLEQNYLERAKSLHSTMSNHPDYQYYDFIAQFVLLHNTTLPDDFYLDEYKDAVTAIQVSEPFFSIFGFEIDEGRLFASDEYIGDNKTIIPVILGNAYKNIYSVGDTIPNVEYLFNSYEFVVVGILKENTHYIRQGNVELADYTMIMPAMIYNNSPTPYSEEWEHQMALASQELCGVYVLNDESEFVNLNAWLYSVVKENGLYKLDFLNVPTSSAFFLQSVSEEYINMTVIMVVSFLLLLFVLFVQMAHYIFISRKLYYEILKICGASIKQILFDILKNVLILSVSANIIAFLATIYFVGIDYSLLIFLISNGTVILTSSLYMMSILKKDYIG